MGRIRAADFFFSSCLRTRNAFQGVTAWNRGGRALTIADRALILVLRRATSRRFRPSISCAVARDSELGEIGSNNWRNEPRRAIVRASVRGIVYSHLTNRNDAQTGITSERTEFVRVVSLRPMARITKRRGLTKLLVRTKVKLTRGLLLRPCRLASLISQIDNLPSQPRRVANAIGRLSAAAKSAAQSLPNFVLPPPSIARIYSWYT